MKSLVALLLSFQSVFGAVQTGEPDKIAAKKIITEIPETTLDFLSKSFSKDAIPGWLLVLSATAVTYHYDDDLLEGTQRTGRNWGLANEDHTKTVWKVGQYDILRLPSDKASALYFLGDGWLDIGFAAGLYVTGAIGGYARPYNTSFQLAHGLIISAVLEQGLKRSFGRESPSDQSEPRGKWRPFPSTKAYNANTAKYDAMPSGHIMTSTLVFTVVRANYPEYDMFVLPLEIGWLTILGFAMVNNGVHWVSDYPLGIAMGYMIGKSAAKLGRPRNEARTTASHWQFYPGFFDDRTATVNALRLF